MYSRSQIIDSIHPQLRAALAQWPQDWIRFTWPGYTYEHTLRVHNLAMTIASELDCNGWVVELAALLHDIGKPAGEPHAEPSAQRADEVLAALGIDLLTRQRVEHIIAHHITVDPLHPLENRVLYDADLVDANYGCVAFSRYITIRAHRQAPIPDMAEEGVGWLERNQDRLAQVMTEPAQRIARARFERMARFHGQLVTDLQAGDGPALRLARFFEADGQRPSLMRQSQQLAQRIAPCSEMDDDFSRWFAHALSDEIAGRI